MFKDLWEHGAQTNKQRTVRLKSDLARLDGKVMKLVDRMLDTDNAVVVTQLEDRMTTLEKEKHLLAEKIANLGKPVRGYREMFEHALKFLANPYRIWTNGTFEDRRNVLKLAFTHKLKYSRNGGLRTPQTSLPFKVLGSVLDGQNGMVRPTGFEPVAPRLGKAG